MMAVAAPLGSHPPLRWAVMGTGLIAAKVTPLLAAADSCTVSAVASRDVARAQEFASLCAAKGVAGVRSLTYDQLLKDADVDAVYVTLPNHLHVPWSLRLLAAGKHVLCEKPFTPFEEEARRVADAAGRSGRVFAEGFMYLHHPQTRRLTWLAQHGDDPTNPIGPLRAIRSVYHSPNRSWRSLRTRLRHDMRGGATMDLGCYCVSFARLVSGEEPVEISGRSRLAVPWIPGLAVDRGSEFRLTFPSGLVCEASAAIDRELSVFVELEGTRGRVRTGWPWAPPPDRAVLNYVREDGRGTIEEVIEHGGDRFTNQFAHFARAVRGEAEPYPSAEWSVGQARAMEMVLSAIGLRFSHQC